MDLARLVYDKVLLSEPVDVARSILANIFLKPSAAYSFTYLAECPDLEFYAIIDYCKGLIATQWSDYEHYRTLFPAPSDNPYHHQYPVDQPPSKLPPLPEHQSHDQQIMDSNQFARLMLKTYCCPPDCPPQALWYVISNYTGNMDHERLRGISITFPTESKFTMQEIKAYFSILFGEVESVELEDSKGYVIFRYPDTAMRILTSRLPHHRIRLFTIHVYPDLRQIACPVPVDVPIRVYRR